MCTYICTYVCERDIYVCMCICIYVYMCVYMHVCVYVGVCICQFLEGQPFLVMYCKSGLMKEINGEGPKTMVWSSLLLSYLSLKLSQDLKMTREKIL